MARVPEAVTVGSDGFALPVEEILTGRGFITGKSGAGKSNTASVVAEELLAAGISLFIIDTDGEYYGLKEQFDVLHAGADSECDVEVGVEDATMLAETALEEDVPVILDVSGFLDGEQVDDLIEKVVKALFHLEKRVRKPFPLFVEEVHEFIPESSGLGDLGETLIRVAKRGRKRGLGLVGMSQRPAAVSKDFITQCDWIVWHRLTWDNDTKVVGSILGSDAADAVQDLGTGEALVMTDWDESVSRVQFRRKRTLDAGATPGLAALAEGEGVDTIPAGSDPGSPASEPSPEDEGADGSAPDDLAEAAATEPPPAGEESASTPAVADAPEDSPVVVESVDGSSPARRDRAAVVEELAARRENRVENRQVTTVSGGAGRRAPADAHPNDTAPVRVLWEFGHMMTHVFWASGARVVGSVLGTARRVGSAVQSAGSGVRSAVTGGWAAATAGVTAAGSGGGPDASPADPIAETDGADADGASTDVGGDPTDADGRTTTDGQTTTDGLTRAEAAFVKASLVVVSVLLVVLLVLLFG